MSVEPAVLVMVVGADKAEALTTIQYNTIQRNENDNDNESSGNYIAQLLLVS
jgi:hypothetical protein